MDRRWLIIGAIGFLIIPLIFLMVEQELLITSYKTYIKDSLQVVIDKSKEFTSGSSKNSGCTSNGNSHISNNNHDSHHNSDQSTRNGYHTAPVTQPTRNESNNTYNNESNNTYNNSNSKHSCNRFHSSGLFMLIDIDVSSIPLNVAHPTYIDQLSRPPFYRVKIVDGMAFVCSGWVDAEHQFRDRGVQMHLITAIRRFGKNGWDEPDSIPDAYFAVYTQDWDIVGTLCPSTTQRWLVEDKPHCLVAPDFTLSGYPAINIEYWPWYLRRNLKNQAPTGRSYLVTPPWKERKSQLVFRGTEDFDHSRSRHALEALIKASKHPELYDFQWFNTFDLSRRTTDNYLTSEQMCHYRYQVYTDGLSASSRLKYILSCGSLVFYAESPYEEFFYGLLYEAAYQAVGSNITRDDKFSPLSAKAWDMRAAYREWSQRVSQGQDPYSIPLPAVIPMDKTWTGLEEALDFLEAHPDFAEAIARNGQRVISILDEDAIECYWKQLLVSYGKRQHEAMIAAGSSAIINLDDHCTSLQNTLSGQPRRLN